MDYLVNLQHVEWRVCLFQASTYISIGLRHGHFYVFFCLRLTLGIVRGLFGVLLVLIIDVICLLVVCLFVFVFYGYFQSIKTNGFRLRDDVGMSSTCVGKSVFFLDWRVNER
jgi:uncharacterized membrane protein